MQAAHPVDHVGVAEPQRSAVLAELQSILASPSFRGSRRCCRFLEYSVHHVLDGAAQELRERNIGIEVFQRSPDYDTAEDAIVRVTANEVRKRLAQFYQDLGVEPDPVISLPPGSYAVTLRWHPVQLAPRSPKPTGRSASSSRFFARRRRSRAHRGEPAWSWASRRSPKPTRATLRSSSNATAAGGRTRSSRKFATRFSSSCRRSTWSSCSCSRT